MNPSSRSPKSENQTTDSNYVDIIDLAAFLWKARVFVLVGIFVGVGFAIAIKSYFKPSRYVVELPAEIELLASNNDEAMLSRFNSAFTSRKNAEKVYEALIASASNETKARLDRMGLSDAVFISLQTSGSPSKTPFLLAAGKTGSYFLQGQYPKDDSLASITLALTDAARKVAISSNEFQLANRDKIAVEKQAQDIEKEKTFESLLIKRSLEEDAARVKLHELEGQLHKKLGSEAGLVFYPNQDQIPRLLGYLKNAGKISDSEVLKFSSARAKLISDINLSISRDSKLLTEASDSFQVASKRAANNASEALGLIPVVKVDPILAKQVIQDGTYQRVESQTTVFVIAGTIGGSILGAATFGILLFIRRNRERIQSAFSQTPKP